jgi:adenylate kinase
MRSVNIRAMLANIRRGGEAGPAYPRIMALLRDRTAWLQGGDAICIRPSPSVWRAWRLMLLGPPGVGKGTQAELLSNALGACPLATGDVFRAGRYAAMGGSIMAEAQAIMRRGELVPDDLVLALIRERLRCLHCHGGFILDGFPRTLAQAHALEALLTKEDLQLDAVISYELPETELAKRVAGRRVCASCHAPYHVDSRPPATPDVCDHCGGRVARRADDEPDAVSVRLHAYHESSAPLIEHYDRKGLLVPMSAVPVPMEILAHTLDALTARRLM